MRRLTGRAFHRVEKTSRHNHATGLSLVLITRFSWTFITFSSHLMKMYPWRDTFQFMQGHVITNQPMAIVVKARETAGV